MTPSISKEAIEALNKAYVLVGMIDCSTWPDEYNTQRMATLIKSIMNSLNDALTKPQMPPEEEGILVRQFKVKNGVIANDE